MSSGSDHVPAEDGPGVNSGGRGVGDLDSVPESKEVALVDVEEDDAESDEHRPSFLEAFHLRLKRRFEG